MPRMKIPNLVSFAQNCLETGLHHPKPIWRHENESPLISKSSHSVYLWSSGVTKGGLRGMWTRKDRGDDEHRRKGKEKFSGVLAFFLLSTVCSIQGSFALALMSGMVLFRFPYFYATWSFKTKVKLLRNM